MRRRLTTLAGILAALGAIWGALYGVSDPIDASHDGWEPGTTSTEYDTQTTGYTTGSPTSTRPPGPGWAGPRELSHTNRWTCRTGIITVDPDTLQTVTLPCGSTYGYGDCPGGSNCGHGATPPGQQDNGSTWRWSGHSEVHEYVRYGCTVDGVTSWSSSPWGHTTCGKPTTTTTTLPGTTTTTVFGATTTTVVGATTTSTTPPPTTTTTVVVGPPPPAPPTLVLESTARAIDDYVLVALGESAVLHMRANDQVAQVVCVGIFCGYGRASCGHMVRWRNGDASTIDFANNVYDGCVHRWARDGDLVDAATTQSAAARLIDGVIVDGYADGPATGGAVQIIGRELGRSEFTYCLTPSWATECDSGTATIVVQVVPAWTDARLAPADVAVWRRLVPTRIGSIDSGYILGYTRDPPTGDWVYKYRQSTGSGQYDLSYCFWNTTTPCTHSTWRSMSPRYTGPPEAAGAFDDLVVFYDGATRVHELPCIDVPEQCTLMRSIKSGNLRWMRLGVVGTQAVSSPPGGSIPFRATNGSPLRHVRIDYSYGISNWLRGGADRSVTTDVEYCFYWDGGDDCSVLPSCVRWTAPGQPNDHLPYAATTLCESGTFTVVVSRAVPVPPAPVGFAPDCVDDTDLDHLGRLIVTWTGVDAASTYDVSINGAAAYNYRASRWYRPLLVVSNAPVVDGVYTIEMRTVRHGLTSAWVTHTVTKPCPPDILPPDAMVCTVAPGGRTTLRWAPALNAERYRLRLDGDDTQILPITGWSDLVGTSWTWPSNPNASVEVASGLLSGTWSAWSAPFDMATACPPPPPLADLALCLDSGTILRWTPPAGVDETDILWIPYTVPTVTLLAADPPQLGRAARRHPRLHLGLQRLGDASRPRREHRTIDYPRLRATPAATATPATAPAAASSAGLP